MHGGRRTARRGAGPAGPIAAASAGLRRLASLVVSAGPAAPGIKIYFFLSLSLSLALALSLTRTLLRIVFVYTRPIARLLGPRPLTGASRGARRSLPAPRGACPQPPVSKPREHKGGQGLRGRRAERASPSAARQATLAAASVASFCAARGGVSQDA